MKYWKEMPVIAYSSTSVFPCHNYIIFQHLMAISFLSIMTGNTSLHLNHPWLLSVNYRAPASLHSKITGFHLPSLRCWRILVWPWRASLRSRPIATRLWRALSRSLQSRRVNLMAHVTLQRVEAGLQVVCLFCLLTGLQCGGFSLMMGYQSRSHPPTHLGSGD